jgi:methylmalonyl-CoA mutase, C-terminal domain
MTGRRRVRVLMAKPGLDGHDRGAKVLTLALRDAGMEVIYTGLHWTPEEIAAVAQQEDVDVVGLSIMSGGQVPIAERVMSELAKRDVSPAVVVGGVILPRDIPVLLDLGVSRVFPVESGIGEIVNCIAELGKAREVSL